MSKPIPPSDRIKPISQTLLADDWATLTKYEFDFKRSDGRWPRMIRQAYDRGNGVACLLHDPAYDTLLLTRQFRLPVFLNGHDGDMIEIPAGLLEGAAPQERMRGELQEETGYTVSKLNHIMDVHMSPGSVTEYLSFYTGTYDKDTPTGQGGGEYDEGEDIEVLHIPVNDALAMIRNGAISDAKTIILIQHLALERLSNR